MTPTIKPGWLTNDRLVGLTKACDLSPSELCETRIRVSVVSRRIGKLPSVSGSGRRGTVQWGERYKWTRNNAWAFLYKKSPPLLLAKRYGSATAPTLVLTFYARNCLPVKVNESRRRLPTKFQKEPSMRCEPGNVNYRFVPSAVSNSLFIDAAVNARCSPDSELR